MATVIDSLVVLLGLDASNYKKGREQAEKETVETARHTKGAADDITKSLLDVGKTVAGLFIGFETATGFAKWLGGLNASEAALGRTSKQLGLGVHELNRYGQAAALLGGSAEGTQAAFQTLTAGVVKFQSGQGNSPIIDLLRQAGISAVDTSGKIRKQGEVFEELASKTARWGSVIQTQRFRNAGLNEDEINYLVRSNEERQKALQTSERHNNVTDDSVQKAQELQQYWRDVQQRIEATGQTILKAITPALETVLDVFGDINADSAEFQTGIKLIGAAAVFIKSIFTEVGDAIGGAVAAFAALLHGDFKGASNILNDQSSRASERQEAAGSKIADIFEDKRPTAGGVPIAASGYRPPTGSKAARFNNPGNILDAAGNERQYGTPDEGQAALERDLTVKMRRGLKTVDAIITAYEGRGKFKNDVPAYIADVRKQLGKNELNEGDIKALSYAIGRHESGPGLQAGPTPGLASRAAGGDGQAAGNQTTVSVGTIQVNAPNADPRAVAAEIPAAIKRKMDISQAAQGQS